ncbi:MAG: response regulator receiver domain [Desulfobacter sp.]
MSDQTADSAVEYTSFIREAFIDPIRTVVVVDDEYPSLDSLIKNESPDEKTKKSWASENIERVNRILNVCRQTDRHWFVDIHDAEKISVGDEKKFAPHLQQTDLMILDYHLDGHDGDGTKAIELLKLLKTNDHFNLVIVYTQGYDQKAGDITRVVREIALGLMSPDNDLELPKEAAARLMSALEEWEDDDPEIVERLKTAVDESAYLKIRQLKRPPKQWLELSEFTEFKAIFENKPDGIKLNETLALKWLVSEKQKELATKLNHDGEGVVSFNPSDEGANWIKTERLFITVVSKSIEPDELTEKLVDALNEWQPHPHRLIMSKMRSELSKRGVHAEEKILENKPLETGWLKGLIDSDDESKVWKIKSSIKNHWDSLGEQTHQRVEKFAATIVDHLSSVDPETLVSRFSLIDLGLNQNEITKQINAFNSSKDVEGYHLATGHVLVTENQDGKEYWLCLSPACDLVPGQKRSGWKKNLGENLPFKAVKLHPWNDEKALKKATENNYLFLDIDDSISVFSFTPPTPKGDPSPNPHWEQMFAKNDGKFEHPTKELSIERIVIGENGLKTNETKFNIVAQLRYEYALSLLQRLGGTLSRVGLDFEKIESEEKS